ncbi:methyltransferase domain-containing protein [Aquisediminimonas profunda]|uniref:methyltransferase domain-containing protein n=1 Tax=Aquisediminimonas profunda TaxID=1550733 RepID=UPI001C629110|nr:methyltransferase domain-containing protein [Aquisediminimonas profunda]
MMPPEIFDRIARRRLRERVLRYPVEDRWIIARMAQDILDRLDAVLTPFRKALVIGGNPAGLCDALSARKISSVRADLAIASDNSAARTICDEDRLPFADSTFDLVVAVGTLDTVSDLPGALVLIQRILSDNGLFIGAMMGAGSLPFLRSCLQQPSGGAPVAARFHPQIDVRGAGDLLARAHFSLPVAESEMVSARYRTFDRLVDDLRANGLTNCLAQRVPLKKADYAHVSAQFSEPVVEQFSIVTLTGWARPRK